LSAHVDDVAEGEPQRAIRVLHAHQRELGDEHAGLCGGASASGSPFRAAGWRLRRVRHLLKVAFVSEKE